MCSIIYLIITYYIFYPCFINKIYIFTYYKQCCLFSLCVSQGGGHFETKLPGYVNIEGTCMPYRIDNFCYIIEETLNSSSILYQKIMSYGCHIIIIYLSLFWLPVFYIIFYYPLQYFCLFN